MKNNETKRKEALETIQNFVYIADQGLNSAEMTAIQQFEFDDTEGRAIQDKCHELKKQTWELWLMLSEAQGIKLDK